jgi:hypothetical protein
VKVKDREASNGPVLGVPKDNGWFSLTQMAPVACQESVRSLLIPAGSWQRALE